MKELLRNKQFGIEMKARLRRLDGCIYSKPWRSALIPTLCQDVFFCERSLQFLIGVILLLFFFLHLTTTRSTQLILNVLVKISTTVLKLILKLFQQKLLQSRHLIDFLALGLLEWHCKSISSGVVLNLAQQTLNLWLSSFCIFPHCLQGSGRRNWGIYPMWYPYFLILVIDYL